MAGRLHGAQLDAADAQRVAVAHGAVRELRARGGAEDDLRAGARGELAMAADEVRVEVRLHDVFDGQPALARRVEVLIDVALRIDDRAFAAVANQVRRVGETGQIELMKVHH